MPGPFSEVELIDSPDVSVELDVVEDQDTEILVLEGSTVEILELISPGAQVAVGITGSDNTPRSVGATSLAGTDQEASRSDHVHAHGNQAGGSLHAEASGSSAGFLSASLFSLLNGATALATGGSLVRRDASGNFSANIITAALSGNAATATKLQTARTINGVSFDGTQNITISAAIANAATFNNSGSGAASGTTFDGTVARTISYNTIGAPSVTGAGASGTWSISVTGNAATATKLATARAINGVNFDGTTAITIQASTPNAVTFNDTGSGAASGTTFTGADARTVSYNTVGAPSVTGSGASGTWNISISGNAATASTAAELATPVNINGVPFDGSTPITITAKPDDEYPNTYFVRSDGSNSAAGTNPHTAFQNIEHALDEIADFSTPEPWTIVLMDGLTTNGELEVPDFTTIRSLNMQRRTIIAPTSGNEESNVFLCGNGVHLYGLKFSGWQIDDFDNPTKGFAMAFRPGAIILPGGVPYGQNCVVTSALTEVPTPLPMDAESGNPDQPRGGGCVLADASVLSAYTVFPNIMTWGFTPSSHNGIGYVAKNRGFINPVNAIGVGQHKHFVCLDGGQMVVSGSSSQFGDYSFWSEGSTQRIEPLKVNPSILTTQGDAKTIIDGIKTTVVNNTWDFLEITFDADEWPSGFEALTKKDSGLFLDAIATSLLYGFERPMLNFAEGMFKFDGTCVYTYEYHAAFKASWDQIIADLIATDDFTTAAETMMLGLVARLKATMDNYWYEEGSGDEPTTIEPVIRKLRSLITAINHQWTAPLSGVEFYRVPPARAARQIRRSIVQRAGGKVRFSGQDDSGNAVFVGGLQIDARSGQLGGPPFDSAIRGRVTRAVISRSY